MTTPSTTRPTWQCSCGKHNEDSPELAGCWGCGALRSAQPDYAQAIYPTVPEKVNHPSHYGGADDPYETIKVIEAWKLGFNLGNTVKYISRAERKGASLEDLKKARWYLDREITNRETGK